MPGWSPAEAAIKFGITTSKPLAIFMMTRRSAVMPSARGASKPSAGKPGVRRTPRAAHRNSSVVNRHRRKLDTGRPFLPLTL